MWFEKDYIRSHLVATALRLTIFNLIYLINSAFASEILRGAIFSRGAINSGTGVMRKLRETSDHVYLYLTIISYLASHLTSVSY